MSSLPPTETDQADGTDANEVKGGGFGDGCHEVVVPQVPICSDDSVARYAVEIRIVCSNVECGVSGTIVEKAVRFI